MYLNWKILTSRAHWCSFYENDLEPSALLFAGPSYMYLKTDPVKSLKALVGRLSLSVGWDNSPERGRKTVSFITKTRLFKYIENFTTKKKMKIFRKKNLIFLIF